jgi:hypothetical protein
MSAIFEEAALTYAECRAEYELVLEAEVEAAEVEANGRTVNRKGLRRGVTTYDLYTHNEVYARAYASREMTDWWEDHPRPTFARFELQWLRNRGPW